jgi:ubiquinone biosynthesis protein COQ4
MASLMAHSACLGTSSRHSGNLTQPQYFQYFGSNFNNMPYSLRVLVEKPDTSLKFRTAWRAVGRLRNDPDNTDEVFVIIKALSGNSGERHYRKFKKTEIGQSILAEKRNLLETLVDRDYLSSLPQDSLGHQYFLFTQREKISAEGLVDASETVERLDVGENRRRFFNRLRDSHDLQHVITGWGRDLLGEGSVLSFGISQNWHHGIGLIVGMAYSTGGPEMRSMIRKAWRRGKQSQSLDYADWERLLPLPLTQVREELGLGEPPVYDPIWSSGRPAAAA